MQNEQNNINHTALLGALKEHKLTVSVAESLTCGLLQDAFGCISGVSEYFAGGLTAYSLDVKVNQLNVERTHASQVNCVSEQVALEMAQGIKKALSTDCAIATTGYAEPSKEHGVTEPFAFVSIILGIKKILLSNATYKVRYSDICNIPLEQNNNVRHTMRNGVTAFAINQFIERLSVLQ